MTKSNIARTFLLLAIIAFFLWLYGLFIFANNIPLERDFKNISSKSDAVIVINSDLKKFDNGLKILQENQAGKMLVTGLEEATTIGMMTTLSLSANENTHKYINHIELFHCCRKYQQMIEMIANWSKSNNYKSVIIVVSNQDLKRAKLSINKLLPNIDIIGHPVAPDRFKIEQWWKHYHMKKLVIRSYNNYLFTKIKFW